MVFFLGLLFAASAVTLYLFYHQTLGNEQHFHSDMKAYILEMQGLNTKYSFPYPVLFKLGALFHLFAPAELAMALATMTLNSLGMVMLKWMLDRRALPGLRRAFAENRFLGKIPFGAGMLISVLAVSMFFVSMLYLPNNLYLPGIRFKYAGVFTANPFHNATYMAARPFAILAFFSYTDLLDRYEKGYSKDGKDGVSTAEYLFFSVSLLLATMAKPSFTLVLVATAGLLMLYRLFRAKLRNFLPTVLLGLCFLPTFADLLYQYKGVFVPGEETREGGIGFCVGEVWHQYCGFIPFAVLLGVGFPLVVLALNWKKLKTDSKYRFSWQLYLMSFLMAYFLYEKGFRKFDFNFSWGYLYGIFFAFVGAILVLVENTGRLLGNSGPSEKKSTSVLGGRRMEWFFLIFQWLAFLAHLVCGLNYFRGLLTGQMYY